MQSLISIARLAVFILLVPLLYFVSVNFGVSYNSDMDSYILREVSERRSAGDVDIDVQRIISEAEEKFGVQNPPNLDEFKSHAYSQIAVIAAILYLILFLILKGGVREALAFMSVAVLFETALHFDLGRFLWLLVAAIVSLASMAILRPKRRGERQQDGGG